jgi:hypothetical protein
MKTLKRSPANKSASVAPIASAEFERRLIFQASVFEIVLSSAAVSLALVPRSVR